MVQPRYNQIPQIYMLIINWSSEFSRLCHRHQLEGVQPFPPVQRQGGRAGAQDTPGKKVIPETVF
jgi:hypothetical protein